MKYLLMKTDSPKRGYWVNQSGRHNSYTNDILEARKFDSRQQAEDNACGNEAPVSVDKILGRHGF